MDFGCRRRESPSTSGVVIEVEARQPRIIRVYASITIATYTQPDQVDTYVMSATHS